jgi:5-methylthioadenosine/S-adenosylhomocysteine deaminase
MAGLREKVAGLRYLETPLVRLGVSPHAPYTVSDDLFRAVTNLAREQHLPMAIHIAESEEEQRLVVDADGPFADGLRRRGIAVDARARSPIQLLSELGVLSANPLLIHSVRVDDDDIKSIASASCPVAHCPASNAKLGHGSARLIEMRAMGITVGLGSDSMASNNRMDILAEARLALLMQRGRLASFETPDSLDVLEIAALGGAEALGLADVVGTLEVGKQADLAAFTLERVRPTMDPIAAAVFSNTGADARFVAVAGRPLLRGFKLTAHRDGLSERIESIGRALADWLDSGGEMQR